MSRTSIRTKLATVAAAGVLALGTGVLAAAPAHADSHGCPSGAVCIFGEGPTWAGPHTDYYSRGAHNLVNQEGWHYIYNNQTAGWTARLCYGYNGTNCENYWLPPGATYLENLSPFNSITLQP